MFKCETLLAARDCIREHPRSRDGFTLVEGLECVEESCTARLAGNYDQHRALAHRSIALLQRNKDLYVRDLMDYFCPDYLALKKLYSMSTPWVSSILAEDVHQVSSKAGQQAP